jgi:hypothetical protein
LTLQSRTTIVLAATVVALAAPCFTTRAAAQIAHFEITAIWAVKQDPGGWQGTRVLKMSGSAARTTDGRYLVHRSAVKMTFTGSLTASDLWPNDPATCPGRMQERTGIYPDTGGGQYPISYYPPPLDGQVRFEAWTHRSYDFSKCPNGYVGGGGNAYVGQYSAGISATGSNEYEFNGNLDDTGYVFAGTPVAVTVRVVIGDKFLVVEPASGSVRPSNHKTAPFRVPVSVKCTHDGTPSGTPIFPCNWKLTLTDEKITLLDAHANADHTAENRFLGGLVSGMDPGSGVADARKCRADPNDVQSCTVEGTTTAAIGADVTYFASEIAGRIVIRGSCTDGSCADTVQTIDVKVPEPLVPVTEQVPALPLPIFVTEAKRHLGLDQFGRSYNVYGNRPLAKALGQVSRKFSDATGHQLVLTDVGLSLGGRYDFLFDWLPPHAAHMYGIDADVRLKTKDGVPLGDDIRAILRFALEEAGFYTPFPGERFQDPDATHWHVRLKGTAPPRSSYRPQPGTATCPPGPNQLALTVTPLVSGAGPSYTYSYTLDNSAGSIQSVSAFQVSVPEGTVSGVASPSGWTASIQGNTVSWHPATTDPDWIDDGGTPPSPDALAPGASRGGFSFQSTSPPGSAPYSAWGYVPMGPVRSEDEIEDILTQCSDTLEPLKGTTTAPIDVLFADDFEAGIAAWSYATSSPDLAVDASAALHATAGLSATVNDTDALYVEDQTPTNERVYRARFLFDPNGFDPGEAGGRFRTRIFLALQQQAGKTRRVIAIVLRRRDGAYSLIPRARNDDNTVTSGEAVPITDGPHTVELAWDAADGAFQMWVDGTLTTHMEGLMTLASDIDAIRLGALNVKLGASGVLFWDAFDSRRSMPVGPPQ